MKLVDTDIEHLGDEDEERSERARPPRPEHRRVYTSLFVTFSVLTATVVAVYTAFPKRDNQLITVALAEHEIANDLSMRSPSVPELTAWTVGVVGAEVPWPQGDGLEVLGTRQISILKRPAALVRYRAGDRQLTLIATRGRDTPPRKHFREEGDIVARSWRSGKWTFIAVGPRASYDQWKELLGVK